MAKKEEETSYPMFNNMPIEDLISTPLEAVVRANIKMSVEQLDAFMRLFFIRKKDGDDNKIKHEPKIITMVITRSGFAPKDYHPPNDYVLQSVTSEFQVPLISLAPINSLLVDNFEVDLDIEITSQEEIEAPKEKDDGDIGRNRVPKIGFEDEDGRKTKLRGNISARPERRIESVTNSTNPYTSGAGSLISVKIQVIQYPLPNGVKSILDMYSRQMDPTVVKDENYK
jgi:hypothetical protein